MLAWSLQDWDFLLYRGEFRKWIGLLNWFSKWSCTLKSLVDDWDFCAFVNSRLLQRMACIQQRTLRNKLEILDLWGHAAYFVQKASNGAIKVRYLSSLVNLHKFSQLSKTLLRRDENFNLKDVLIFWSFRIRLHIFISPFNIWILVSGTSSEVKFSIIIRRHLFAIALHAALTRHS